MDRHSQRKAVWKYAQENLTVTFLALAGLLVLFGITIWMWKITTVTEYERQLAIFDTLTQDNEHAMRGRIDLYRQSLDGGAALFEATDVVSLEEWRSYVDVLDIEKTLPGINGIGFIMPVPRSKIEEYLEFGRNRGVGNITIHPVTDSPEILPITYIEPVNMNREAVGLDLVQDNSKSSGFLLLRPMYQRGRTPETTEMRRAAFRGWIYAPFIASRFMAGLTKSQDKDFDIEVYDDKESRAANLIFASNSGEGEFSGDGTDLDGCMEEYPGTGSQHQHQGTLSGFAGRHDFVFCRRHSDVHLCPTRSLC